MSSSMAARSICVGPAPVEVGQRLEVADVGRAQAPLEAAATALGAPPSPATARRQRACSGSAHHLGPVGQQAMQTKARRPALAGRRRSDHGITHRVDLTRSVIVRSADVGRRKPARVSAPARRGARRARAAQRDRRRQALRLAGALQCQAHGVGVRHVALERLGDGRLQRGGAIALEQAQQRGGDRAEVVAALGRRA